jgi:Anti-sigma-K factor rskA/Putative zinc-finger
MSEHTQYAETLALYALDALDNAEERAALEAHLATCQECRSELEALRGDTALLALSAVGPAPPQRSRQRLLDAIHEDVRRSAKPQRMIVGVLRPRWLTFAPIAATLLLAIFGLALGRSNLRLRNRLDHTEAQLQEYQQQLAQAQAVVDLLNAPDAQHLTLVKANTPPQPQIKMIYSPRKGGLLLMANNLDPLPQDKVYELWLLPMNGSAPMPAGTFKPQSNGSAMMDHSMTAGIEAKAFAITVEPEGGSQTPTMPIKMLSAG